MERIVVTLHGGNFVGGDASWDAEQTQLLRRLGFTVHQLAFAKDTLSVSLQSIREQVLELKKQHPASPFFVIGRSSGGYLAKVLFDEGLFSKAIYLAPVFAPILRSVLIPALGQQSRSFFANEVIPASTRWSHGDERLLLATNDENVPLRCFTQEQMEAAQFIGPRTHSEMVKVVSREFRDIVCDFFRIPQA